MAAISAGTALLSGPSRIFSIMAQGMTAVLIAELGFRVMLTATTILQTGSLPQDYQFKEQSDFSKNIFDFRQLTRNLETRQLFVSMAIASVANFGITESVYQLFGPPVLGVSLLGRCIGLETTTKGIWAKLPALSEFSKFWHVAE